MKRLFFIPIILLLFTQCHISEQKEPVDYVNTLIGTNNNPSFSHGNTYPAVTHPFGMNFWTPQTEHMGDTWIYVYNSDSIRGFKQTHLPSPWIGDYGAFSIMPVSGTLKVKDTERAAAFSHAEEIATPYYYSVKLQDYEILAEMTATERCGFMQFTFDNDNNYIVLDAYHQGASVKIIPEEQMIVGYCKNRFAGAPENFTNFFVIQFDQPFESFGVWNNEKIFEKKHEIENTYAGGYIKFPAANKKVSLKIASSYISLEQAHQTLSLEIGEKSFEDIKSHSRQVWNKHLSKVEIEGNNEEQLRTFYSNFYRTSLYPRKFYEIDEQGTPHHFSPYNGKINTGYMYTDNGFWDTFRSAHPWLTLILPSISIEIMQSLLNTYNEGGWLPSWASPGYRDSMIGSHAVSLITDAYQKGITDFDAEKAFEAVVKDCFQPAPKKYIGRYGYKEYNEKGYIPYPEYEQATSMSLEYAYDDFCIYRLAELLGKNQDTLDMFKERAKNYIHSFDTTTGFMRPRKADGSWYSPFTPYLWGGPFTEGNSWQYSWSVFHDIQGLINLHGSNEAFVNKMDSLFKVPLNAPLYGRYFNEIAEMHNASFGQYAHGNQPDQHFAYLYNYAGQSWKTQRLVRKIMDRLYNSTPNGYCGDEDNGQTSSWYLFSAIGFYPVCPGTGQYVFGSPLFNTVKLHLENGKTFTVKTFNNKPGNCYIDNIEINGEKYTPLYISHKTITEGTTLFFNMSSRPNKNLKLDKKDLPYSLSNEIKN